MALLYIFELKGKAQCYSSAEVTTLRCSIALDGLIGSQIEVNKTRLALIYTYVICDEKDFFFII